MFDKKPLFEGLATVDEFTVDEVDDDEDDPNIIENEDLEEDFDQDEEYYDLQQDPDNLNKNNIEQEVDYQDAFEYDQEQHSNFGQENVIKNHNDFPFGYYYSHHRAKTFNISSFKNKRSFLHSFVLL